MIRLLAVFATLLAATAASAPGRPPVAFPRDHYGHARSDIEWWYFTAFVHDASGTRYSVFFTLFASRGSLIPISQVVNLKTGALVGHTEGLAAGQPGARSLDVKTAGTRLRYQPKSNRWFFSAAAPAFAVSLVQHPLKPYALHGRRGLIDQSAAGTSHYYSSTRMTAAGTLRVGTATMAIHGQSWFDHQWGNYRDDPRAFNWDWFSCRFDDDTELMLYQFLDPATGQPLAVFRSGTYVDAAGQTFRVRTSNAIAGTRSLRDSGHTWPLDWTLDVTSPSLTETLTSLLPDELVRNTILPTFWEGPATAIGTKHGSCFVEISYR